jgi:hypothetical protein
MYFMAVFLTFRAVRRRSHVQVAAILGFSTSWQGFSALHLPFMAKIYVRRIGAAFAGGKALMEH